MLDWRTIIASNDPRHDKRGSELECAIVPGYYSRFAIYTVRRIEFEPDTTSPLDAWGRHTKGYWAYDVNYRIRDAERIRDADVRAGKQPPIIGEYRTLDEALAALPPPIFEETDDDEISSS